MEAVMAINRSTPENFVYDNTSHNYNIIKITIAIWLEGWDADFFRGIPQDASIFDINLGFKLELK